MEVILPKYVSQGDKVSGGENPLITLTISDEKQSLMDACRITEDDYSDHRLQQLIDNGRAMLEQMMLRPIDNTHYTIVFPPGRGDFIANVYGLKPIPDWEFGGVYYHKEMDTTEELRLAVETQLSDGDRSQLVVCLQSWVSEMIRNPDASSRAMRPLTNHILAVAAKFKREL